MAYGDFKYLPRRAASDKMLRDKAFDIAKSPKYDRYQHGLAATVSKFFDKKSSWYYHARQTISRSIVQTNC